MANSSQTESRPTRCLEIIAVFKDEVPQYRMQHAGIPDCMSSAHGPRRLRPPGHAGNQRKQHGLDEPMCRTHSSALYDVQCVARSYDAWQARTHRASGQTGRERERERDIYTATATGVSAVKCHCQACATHISAWHNPTRGNPHPPTIRKMSSRVVAARSALVQVKYSLQLVMTRVGAWPARYNLS